MTDGTKIAKIYTLDKFLHRPLPLSMHSFTLFSYYAIVWKLLPRKKKKGILNNRLILIFALFDRGTQTCFCKLSGHENYVIFIFTSLQIACKSCSIFSVQIFAMSRCASVFTLVFCDVWSAVRLVGRKCASYHAPRVTHTVIMSIAKIFKKKIVGKLCKVNRLDAAVRKILRWISPLIAKYT